jgi:hypothetical protein
MNAINELLVYARLRKLADLLSDSQISSVLEDTSRTVDGIKRTPLYKQVQQRLRDGAFPMSNSIATMLSDLQHDHPNLDSSAILWLIGLRCAATMDKNESDPEQAMQIQLMLFLAAQSDNFYRITDDRMRLLVTHTYLQTATKILFKSDNN